MLIKMAFMAVRVENNDVEKLVMGYSFLLIALLNDPNVFQNLYITLC